MKVKVLKCENSWYKNEIGNIFEVSNKPVEVNEHMNFSVKQNGIPTALCIRIEDCEEVK